MEINNNIMLNVVIVMLVITSILFLVKFIFLGIYNCIKKLFNLE